MAKYIGLYKFHPARLTRPSFNMRPPIAPESVAELKQSMSERLRRGLPINSDALIVSPAAGEKFDPKSQTQVLYVLSGNRRHAACEALACDAQLHCQVYEYDTFGEMLVDMGVPNIQRADPPALSLAKYYAHCLQHMPMHQLVKSVGKSANTIAMYLALLEKLGEAAQELLNAGDLSLGVARELFALHAFPTIQAKVAAQLARRGATQAVARKMVNLALKQMSRRTANQPNDRIEGTGAPAIEGQPVELKATLQHLRDGARRECAACPSLPMDMAEPAWHLAINAAGHVCTECGMRAEPVCRNCPLTSALKRVVRSVTSSARVHAEEGRHV
jgi:ParB/RepB/Spo0J family partition protein